MKPITPKEAREAKNFSIPDFIIEAVNTLIVKNMKVTKTKSYSTVIQDEIIAEAIKIQKSQNIILTRNEIFDNSWLDFEDTFRAEGWKVVYDKPGYNEDYEASFKFEAGTGKD